MTNRRLKRRLSRHINGDQDGRAEKLVAVLQVWLRLPFLARYARLSTAPVAGVPETTSGTGQ